QAAGDRSLRLAGRTRGRTAHGLDVPAENRRHAHTLFSGKPLGVVDHLLVGIQRKLGHDGTPVRRSSKEVYLRRPPRTSGHSKGSGVFVSVRNLTQGRKDAKAQGIVAPSPRSLCVFAPLRLCVQSPLACKGATGSCPDRETKAILPSCPSRLRVSILLPHRD